MDRISESEPLLKNTNRETALIDGENKNNTIYSTFIDKYLFGKIGHQQSYTYYGYEYEDAASCSAKRVFKVSSYCFSIWFLSAVIIICIHALMGNSDDGSGKSNNDNDNNYILWVLTFLFTLLWISSLIGCYYNFREPFALFNDTCVISSQRLALLHLHRQQGSHNRPFESYYIDSQSLPLMRILMAGSLISGILFLTKLLASSWALYGFIYLLVFGDER